MKRKSFGISDTGRVRSNNEDSYLINDAAGFTVVADGMGGHAAGEVASKVSVDEASLTLEFTHLPEEMIVIEAIRAGNSQILKKIESDQSLKGMGTTICIVKSFEGNRRLQIGYVGDSRIYRLRGARLEQLSVDDSLIREQLSKKIISVEEAERSPFRHVLTKALGVNAEIDPGTETYDILPDDVLLSCTDGLTDIVKDSEIEEVILRSESVKAAANALIALALKKGGKDNVTVVLTQFFNQEE